MDSERTYPVSLAQESMWFMQEVAGASDVYNETGALDFIGPFDRDALARAVELTFLKSPAFRATFHLIDGEVRLALRMPSVEELVQYRDLSDVPEADAERVRDEVITDFAHASMDLATGPVGRFLVLRLAEQRHQVVAVFHHIIADRITQTILLTDIVGFYLALTSGQQPTVEPQTAEYLEEILQDRVLADRRRIEESFPHAEDYWRGVVPPDLGELPLPFTRPRPAQPTGEGDYVPFSLDQATRQAVSDLAERLGVTKFVVMLALYTLLLWRYSNASTVPVQVAMNTRRPEQANEVGLFVNSIPVLGSIDERLTVEEHIRTVNQALQGAFGFRTFPFSRVVEIVAPERGGINPLAQVSMTYSKHLAFDATFGDLRLTYVHVQKSGAKGDLALEILDHGDRFDGGFNYSTEMFDRATIERAVGHYRTLLAGVLADPGRRLRDVDILTEAERARLTAGENQAAPFDEAVTLAELFSRQAQRTPQAEAVRFGGSGMSYAELDRAATALAQTLAARGVGPDVPVAVCLERSFELIVALLAIHKAGGAYVPLDPEDPANRRALTIADTGAPLLLTFTRHLEGLRTDAVTICLDDPQPAPEAGPPPMAAGPRDLAYIIFTSGSTGRPKGVQIEHRSVVNLLTWRQRMFPIGPGDRLLHKTPYTFDPSVWQFFWPLINGATLVLATPDGHRDLNYIARTIDEERITHTQFVPSVVPELARCVPAGGGTTLRHVSVGGEALTREQATTFFEAFPGCELVNTYGPAECTVESTYCVESAGHTGTPTIGRPVDNAAVYVLDDQLRPCPVGVVGELCVAGPLVGRGYRHLPDRTAAAFVPNPFRDDPDYARMYRTGDRARWNEAGDLEFMGREDDQVKIRGHRVEIAEVEARVAELPGVVDSAVVARKDQQSQTALVAYLVGSDLEGSELLEPAQMRARLAADLPDYMLPSAFVVVQGLPRTRHDKLDVKALPDPDTAGRDSGVAFVEPRTPTERALAGIWADVLGAERVGIDDDFFLLGGHSLLATRLVTRAGAQFGIDVPVRALFDHSTVRALAEFLDAAEAGGAAPAITGADRSGPIPLSYSQERLWFLDQFEPGNPAYNVPGALDITGPLDIARIRAAVNTIYARHEILRTCFREVGGQAQQVVQARSELDIPVIDTDAAGTDAVIRELAVAPFDLARGPLVRAAVLRRGPEDFTLVIAMHHIVSDAWSMAVFIKELHDAYLGQELPELRLQYADYAAWQRRWLQGEALDREVRYWVRSLEGATPLELPADRPRPETPSYRGAVHKIGLEPELAEALHRIGSDHDATSYMTLLGLVSIALARTANTDDLVIGSVIAGRNHPGIESIIGFFVNTLALRVDLTGDPTFGQVLARLRGLSLEAAAHQDAPFERVVDAAGGERDTSRQALFDVMFVHHIRTQQPETPEGFFLWRHEIPETTAKFDLTVTATETPVGIRVEFNYATDLFDEATIERLAGHFRRLVEEVIEDPGRRISELTMLTAPELAAIERWNDTAAEYPAQATITDLFAEQVRIRPDAVAVINDADGESLTFAELNARANQVAHLLRARGVGPGRNVALLLERSPETVVGILGVLKAGGVYVPMEPELPDERIATILADTDADVLLTTSDLAGRAAAAGRPVLHLDAPPPALSGDLVPGTVPEDLAYILYTSGSTGLPKGAMIRLGSVVNLIHWHRHRLAIGAEEVVLLKTPYDHDISVTELFIPLILGSTLVVAVPGGHRDPEYLTDVVRRREVTVLHFVPTMLREFANARGFDGCTSLRHVFSGGEALSRDLIGTFTQGLPGAALHNMYGPTETCDYTSMWEADPDDPAPIGPIGRPIDNMRAYLVDRWNRLVPVGTPGELCVAGAGTGPGYLGRPELTAEKYVTNPFDDDYPTLYRSGDICRWRPDGVMEFVRRDDGQVKVRGHRVETGEVEAVLNAHPGVAISAVMLRTDVPGVHRLVAYVATGAEDRPGHAPVTGRDLREWCSTRVPEFAVPSAFVVLAELPHLPNGKIDRRSLPAPAAVRPEDAAPYVPPTTRTERILAEVWSEILGVDRVGAQDNFFELGGDSILSIRMVARAREAGVTLAVRSVFLHETVADLAAHIDAAPAQIVAAEQGPVLGAYPLTPIQEWFFAQDLPSAGHFNQSVRVPLPDGDVAAALAAVASHHDVFRLRFGDRAVAEPVPDTDLWPVETADADTDFSGRLDIARGPLARAIVDGDELVLIVHHLIVDGVSWRILADDLQTALSGTPLPDKTTSYRSWAEHLHRDAHDPGLRAELAYWQQQLDAESLPPAGPNTEADARTARVSLDPERTAHLLTDAHTAYRTHIDDLLLAALHRTFGIARLGVDLESHGRSDRFEDVDTSRTVGWFTSLYPIALDAPVGPDVAASIIAVKEQRAAVPDHGIGYGILRWLTGAAELDRPSHSIAFNYLGRAEGVHLDLGGGADRAAEQARAHYLDVNAAVVDGRLEIAFTCPQDPGDWARRYLAELEAILDHCLTADGVWTPSDFPLAAAAGLTAQALADIDPADLQDIYPLTPLQQGMVFHSLVAPESGEYVEQLSFTIDTDDPAAFEDLWCSTLNGYETFRTEIMTGVDVPLAVVRSRGGHPVTTLDWADRADAAAGLPEFLADDRRRGLDLAHAPLWRLTRIRLAGRTYRYVWTFHHVLLDGWSYARVLGMILKAADGHPAGPPAAEVRDHAAWLARQDRAAAEAFWAQDLSGFTTPTKLSLPPAARGTSGQGTLNLRIEGEEASRITDFARHTHATTNTVVQAAWALLLSRYTGHDDVLFGTTTSGRPTDLPGADEIVGCLINTIPARVRIRPEAIVADWLRDIQQGASEARQYEYLGLTEIQQVSEMQADTPLFHSILVFENFPLDALAGVQDASVRDVQMTEQTNYALSVVCAPAPGGGLEVRFVYDRAVYPQWAMENLLTHFRRLLSAISADRDRRLGDIRLLTTDEVDTLLEWGIAPAVPYPDRATIPQIVAQWAAATPSATAVVTDGDRLDYASLNAAANRLAHHLLALGLSKQQAVGICLDRNNDMIVALLAVLKAGAGYVPLDPDDPPERVRFMTRDTGMSVVITQQAHAHLFAPPVATVCVDADAEAIAGRAATDPAVRIGPDDVAYCLYTSGSTGEPKGVLVTHRGVVRLVANAEWVALGPDRPVMFAAPLAFDASTFDIWSPLLNGSTCVVYPDRVPTMDGLRERIRSNHVDTLILTTKLFNTVVDEDPEILQGVSQVLTGGEAASSRHWAALVHALPEIKVINVYGPTEAAVISTTWVAPADLQAGDVIPIGRPMANTRVYVLGPDGDMLPVGVSGELCIGGPGVALGYLNRDELTAQVFVPDPFVPGARMYRSGDIVRWLPDGTLDYTGRTDDQVKIRGHRIELGEVASALEQHPSVLDVIVLSRKTEAGDVQLIAYIEQRPGLTVTAAELHAWSTEHLSDFMWPAAYVVMDRFPVNRHGKVDRHALPEPDLSAAVGSVYQAPRTPTEEILADIWAEVLDRPKIGIEDDFFAIGGHSLLATRVVSRIKTRLNVEVPIASIFEHPTVAALAGLLAAGEPGAVHRIPRADRGSPLPLSYAQERLWFLDQWNPGDPTYNIPAVVRLTGRLDAEALQRALTALVARHEGLRTTFPTVDGRPLQDIAAPAEVPIEFLTAGSDDEVERIVEAAVQRRFDLANGPLLHVTLVEQGVDDHVLIIAMHHSVSDGWSMVVLIGELGAAYQGGGELSAEPLAVQYPDFAVWQREWLAGGELQRQIDYWTAELAGAGDLELPSDFPRPAEPSHRGAVRVRTLDPGHTERLAELARSEGATEFMAFLAVVEAVLARSANQEDFVIGSIIAGRNAPGVEGLIGFFVNTLALPADVAGDPTFRELLRQVRDTCLGAYSHQDVPFEALVDGLAVPRDTARHPLFQVAFTHENTPPLPPALGGLHLEPVPIPRNSAKFDLNITTRPRDGAVEIEVEYATDLFAPATVDRLIDRIERLLAGAADGPDRHLSDLPFLTVGEAELLTTGWNDTGTEHPGFDGRTLVDLFAEQVTRTPDAAAVTADGTGATLTYAELDARSNAVAHQLRDRGVTANSTVGLCLERHEDIVVGIVAILKAGGAYVPVDPTEPAGRQAFTLQDADARVVLTQRRYLPNLPGDRPAIALDDPSGDWPDTPLPPVAGPGDLAYVIYTSGSTGQPKGVQIEHSAIVNLLAWRQATYPMGPGDTLFHKTPITFDPSVWQFLWPLITGGRLLLATPEGHRDLPYQVAVMAAEHVTHTQYVPSVLDELVKMPGLASCTGLQHVSVGGEALAANTVEAFFRVLPGARLINTYGPAECAIETTFHESLATERGTPPIGRPIDNARVYVLDERGNPVPIGVPGELCIAGAGLMRGYLNRPDAEAAAMAEFAGGRIYRTGDFARWLPTGDLDFLGRRDGQVKIRGHRVETGEVAGTVRSHPGVVDAAVVIREDRPGDHRLVAYLVGPELPEPPVLRRFCGERLPDYMVPAAFVALDHLPLTKHGKLDTKALPAPEYGLSRDRIAPRTEVERALAEIWQEVLGVDKVGIDDNFFELGGDSILSIRIVHRALQAGLGISVQSIFTHQTIAALAAHTDAGGRSIHAEQGPAAGTVPLTPIQKWFFDRRLPRPHWYDQAFTVPLPDGVSAEEIRQALAAVAMHHDALRLRFRAPDGSVEQYFADVPSDRIWPLVEVRPGADLLAETTRLLSSFDLPEGPLAVAAVLEGEPRYLFLAAHHLVVDTVSWRIMLEDVQTIFSGGRLPDKTTGFQHWAQRLAEYHPASELEHWAAVVATPVPGLPLADPAAANAEQDAAAVTVTLPITTTRLLLTDAAAAYHTQINDLLLTALQQTFSRWTGSGLLRIDLEGHGREELFDDCDVSRTVGWFTSVFPLLLDVPPSADLPARITAVKEQSRAVPRNGVGYGSLLRAHPELACTPELSFNYLGQVRASVDTVVSVGPERAPEQVRDHAIDIVAAVVDGQLRITVIGPGRQLPAAELQRLAEDYRSDLEAVVAHCAAPGTGAWTPSDFPLADLTQQQVDAIAAGTDDLEDVFALTGMQHGMLYHSLVDPAGGDYVEQLGFTVETADPAAFEAAWLATLNRHGLFRARIVWDGLDAPVHVVSRRPVSGVESLDWSAGGGDHGEALEAWLLADRRRGFDFARPPWRLTRIRLSAHAYRYIWTFHHLLMDGWSNSALFSELVATYTDLSLGSGITVTPGLEFRDYVAWLRSQDRAAAGEFWAGQLAGFDAAADLDLPAPLEPPDGHRTVRVRLDAARVGAAAERMRITVNTLLQGGWAYLLHRYTDRPDVTFGVTTSGRPDDLPGAGGIIGCLINTLPLRVEIRPEQSVADFLAGIQQRAAECRAHDYLTLPDIARAAGLPPDTELFASILVFENAPLGSVPELPGIRFADVAAREQTNYPLTVVADPSGGGLTVDLIYDTAVYDSTLVERIAQHLSRIVMAMAADPGADLAGLPMLGSAELHQIRAEWNATAVDFDDDRTWPQMVHDQAAARPDQVAVLTDADGTELTYRALSEAAGVLARHLQATGIGRDDIVALTTHRSPEMIVGLLGISTAGAAYVPLDPDYPQTRREFILADTGARIVVTVSGLRHLFDDLDDTVQVLCIDDLPGPAPEVRLAPVDPAGLAYVIYTSGSTGQPKGVMVEHRGFTNFLLAQGSGYARIPPGDRTLISTPYTFDALTGTVHAGLVAGATLVLAGPEAHRDPEQMADVVRRRGITTCGLVPSQLLQLAEQPGISGAVRRILVGGERLARPQVVAAAQVWPDAELHNLYGPTETTNVATSWLCEATDQGDPPIGRPMANVQVYVLDAALRPVPVGVPGQLGIAGAGVSRGYLGRPDLTARSFVDNPFGDGRLYLTGDRCRQRADGAIVYIGRADDQVKLRGNRVELTEIVAVLREHPAVSDAAVLIREDRPGDQRLVGYVVTEGADDLRQWCAQRLPAYEVPSPFVVLPAIPLTAHGKLDTRALPPPELAQALMEPSAAEPQTPTEAAIAAIWAEVLGLPQVGVDQGFYELGGHSLLATRVISRVNQSLGTSLPVRSVLSNPTVRALAAQADCGGVARDSYLVTLHDGPEAPPLILLPAAGDLASYRPLVQRLASARPVWGLLGVGWEPLPERPASLADLADRYAAEIRSALDEGPYLLAGWSMGGLLAMEVARRLEANGEVRVALLDTYPDSGFADEQALEAWLALLHSLHGDNDPFESVRRANAELMVGHRPAFHGGRVDLFVSTEGEPEERRNEQVSNWQVLAPDLRVVAVPGDHATMLMVPNVDVLARELARSLTRLRQGSLR